MTVDEAWIEAFEEALKHGEPEAYLQAARDLSGIPELTPAHLASDPLLLLPIQTSLLEDGGLEIRMRVLRWWRWKSRHFYESQPLPVKTDPASIAAILQNQDLTLLRTLCQLMPNASNPKPLCYLINSILLEAPHLLKQLLEQRLILPEALPFCIEYAPAFHTAHVALQELFSSPLLEGPYRFYACDLLAWLALRYPSTRLEPLVALSTASLRTSLEANDFHTSMAALTIGTRLCLALPHLALPQLTPLLEEIEERARTLATGDQLEQLTTRQAELTLVVESRRANESTYLYNKVPSCI